MQGPTGKIIKAFLISFVALIAFCLIAAVFMTNEYEVKQVVEIKAPAEKVFPLVADFSQWKAWSPWYTVEPTAKFVQEGKMQSVGSAMAWDGKIIGTGKMTIAEIQNNQKITINMHFEKHRKIDSVSEFLFESNNGSTQVTWSDHGTLSYPIGRIFSKYIKAMISKDFEEGLNSLKTRAEKP